MGLQTLQKIAEDAAIESQLNSLQKKLNVLDAELKQLLTDDPNLGEGGSIAIRMSEIFAEAEKINLEKTNARREKGALARFTDAGEVYISAATTAQKIINVCVEASQLAREANRLAAGFYQQFDDTETTYNGLAYRLSEHDSIADDVKKMDAHVTQVVADRTQGGEVTKALKNTYLAESRR